MAYTFDFIDSRGRIDHFDFAFYRNDEEASAAAKLALRTSSHAIRVAIWDEARRVAVLDRDCSQHPQDWIADRISA